MKYRPHLFGGTMDESLERVLEVQSLEDIRSSLGASRANAKLECEYYAEDKRHPDWHKTYIVTADGDAVGYTNGPLL